MFEYFRLKKMELQYKVLLLQRLHGATKLLDNIPMLLEVADKLKDTDQKEIVSKLAEVIHSMNQTKDGE